jgi:hypothetical protein
MTQVNWNIMVSYAYTSESILLTDMDGQNLDKTIYRGETDTITFHPSSGVRSIDSISITSPNPLPAGVSVTQATQGRTLVVTDMDNLASDASAVDVVYCLHFTDGYGNKVDSDPKLINMPILRPT